MSPEQVDVLILGSGQGGKLLAWHMAQAGRRTAVVERRWIGGSCPNIACMPSKNEIWSAKVAHLAHHAGQFGTVAGPVETDMAAVRQRKRDMVNREIELHLQNYRTSGVELIMGSGRFVAPKTARSAPQRWRHARPCRRAGVPEPGHASGSSGYSRPQCRPAAHAYRGARTRLSARASDRTRRWLCRPRNGAGLSPFRQPSDRHRARLSDHEPRGPRRCR